MRRTRTDLVLALAGVFILTTQLGVEAATTIISRSASWKYRKGTAEASDPRSDWRLPDFDDSGWSSGNLPLGYGVSGLGTTLSDMQNNYSSVFLRKTFTLTSVDADLRLRALVDWDDGFILWINGERVLDKDEPDGTPLHTSLAADYHASGVFETEELPDPAEYLEVGPNVIAVQLFNKTLDSSDAKVDVELVSFKRVADTKFSHDRGFYDAAFTLTISSATAGATIRYTTDGSQPTAGSPLGGVTPVTIPVSGTLCVRAFALHTSEYEDTDIDTQTYIFLDSVLTQAQPAGYPDYLYGYNASAVLITHTADYAVASSVVDSSSYSNMIRGAFRSIPTISIVMNKDDAFGSQGFLVNGWSGANDVWEKPCSAELIYPDSYPDPDAGPGFQIDCGVRPHSHVRQKRSMKLMFTSDYGPTKLRYPFFESAPLNRGSACERFDKVILRAGMNRGWAGLGATEAVYTRDQWVRDTQIGMWGYGKHGTYVHVYINGLYWGLYNAAERADEGWANQYFGGEKEDWFAANHGGDITTTAGADDRYDYLVETIGNNGSLDSQSNYNTLRQYLDVQQFIDYVTLGWFCGFGDWQEFWGKNNFYFVNRNNPAGPGMYIMWDVESCWHTENYKASRANERAWIKPEFLTEAENGSRAYEWYDTSWRGGAWARNWYQSSYHKHIARPFRNAFKNMDYRTLYADRLYRHGKNGGVLTDAECRSRWMTLCDFVEDAMVCEEARWGDHAVPKTREGNPERDMYGTERSVTYYSYGRNSNSWSGTTHDHNDNPIHDSWYEARDHVYDLMGGNADLLINLSKAQTMNGHVMYPLIDPPVFNQHGGAIGAGFALTLTNPNAEGTLVYKTDGTDPRKWDGTGGQASGTSVYGSPIAMSRTTHIKARVRKTNGTWSAVRAATYNYTAHYPLIKITELMYNPIGGGDFEFVEIKNTSGSTTVGLSEMTFSGLSYTFAAGTELTPGQIIVLARNATAFNSQYGFAPFGEYQGGLDNGGERIRLKDCDGATVTTVRYNDNAPWPEEADGDGYSLCFDGTGDQDDPLKWRRSNLIGGSPGYDEAALYDVVINEALTHTDLPQVDAVELYNAGVGSVNIGGWYLSDTVANYKKFQIPSTTLNAGDYVVFDETDFGTWALDSHGDEVYLTHWDGSGNLLYLNEATFGGAANGVAFGRHVRTDREIDFVAQSVSNTLDGANAYPLVGPVVINELMYNTLDPADPEYIELHNVSDSAVNLYDPAAPTNGWMLDGAVEYTFASGDTIDAGEYVLVVPTNETAFRAAYPGVPGDVQVFGPYAGRLDNGGESVKLWRPDTPDPEGVPRILVDRVKYDDDSLWVESPDGRGPSLERVASSLYGNDPANWAASAETNGTPGEANSGVLVAKTAGWRYHDEGLDLGTGWRLAAYDDYGWDHGNGALGYPDTNPAIDTELDFGGDPSGKYTTTYFRTRFMLDADPANVNSLTLRIRYDDGYVAYLNGQEVARGGMPTGGITHYTLANTQNGSGGVYEEENLGAHIAKLVQGVNVLAVEVHQISAGSSDLFMDLALLHTVTQLTPAALPTFSPPDGTEFSGASLNVTVSTATSGATVFYTTDGRTPSDTDNDGSGVNSVIVNLTASRTIKARAYADGYAPSPIGSASYTRILPTVATPTIDPDGGDFYGSVNVTVSTATSGATVFYTTDGSTPSDSNYAGFGTDSVQFALTQDRTVKARAYKFDYNASSVATASFDERTPTVGFDAATDSGSESQTSPSLTVELSGSSIQTVTVDYSLGGGTATPGVDYTATGGRLTFSPGQTVKNIGFTVNDDGDIETNETVIATLSNPANANAGQMTLTYTIADNDQPFTAYNDLCWTNGQTSLNNTTYTIGQSGLLVDYATGESTPVTLQVTGGGGPYAAQGVAPNSGTDAYDIFYDSGRGEWKADPVGLISYASNLTLAFSDADPGLRYEVVVFGNRGSSAYVDRESIVTLGDVEPGFTNTSSAGTTVGTNALPGDTTTVGTGYNTVNGHVARYTWIDPGADGAFTVTVEDSTTKFYANTLMLRVLEQVVAIPQFNPGDGTEFTTPTLDVTISTATAGATVFYTTDGSTPDTGSANNGTASVQVTLYGSATVKARAYASAHGPSTVATASYTQALPVVADPTIDPDGGDFYGSVEVTLSSATSGATIFYTTDGADPTTNATPYAASPFSLTNSATVKARAFKTGYTPSGISSASFTRLIPGVETPQMAPGDGTIFTNSVDVTLTTGTSGATIFYTTDGSDPSTNATPYLVGPVTLTETTTLKARGYRDGYNPSDLASAAYTEYIPTAATPQMAPGDGTVFTNSVDVTLTTGTSGATIFYTTDGSAPDTNATAYTGAPVNLTATTTLKARAYRADYYPSALATASYTEYIPTVATPTITPNGGGFYETVDVTLATATAGATIFYTTDGSDPTLGSTAYPDSPFSLTGSATVKARAYRLDYNPSAIASAAFTDQTPTVGFAAGSSGGAESVSNVLLSVVLSGTTPYTATVACAVSGGTAVGGVDYTAVPGTLTFMPGTLTNTFVLTVAEDADPEPNETIVLTLSNTTHALPGVDTHTYTILDNDAPEAWLEGYQYRRRLTVEPDLVDGPSDLTNFAVVVNTTQPELAHVAAGGHVENANGWDIQFTLEDGTNVLSHELEAYLTNGTLTAWVRLPVLAHDVRTRFYLYYGNTNIVSSQENVTDVWDSGYVGVWHLSETPTGAADEFKDSTVNAYHGSMRSGSTMDADDQQPGQVDGALDFNGESDTWLNMGDGGRRDVTGPFTLSVWAKRHEAGGFDDDLFNKGWSDCIWFHFGWDRVVLAINNGVSNSTTRTAAQFTDTGGWYHLVGTHQSGTQKIFVNGEEQTLDRGGKYWINPDPNNNGWFIGGYHQLYARVDEARMSDVVRSPQWIAACYRNQGQPSTFLHVGGEELPGYRPVSLALGGSQFAENGGIAVVLATIPSASPFETTAQIALAGTAANGVDYTASATNIVIPAGNTNGTITLTGLDDGAYEGREDVVITLDAVINGVDGDVGEVTASIVDDEIGWVAGYEYRIPIEIDPSAVDSDLTNFPVLVGLVTNDLKHTGSGGHVAHVDGWDMRFAGPDGTNAYDYEIEAYVSDTGELTAWVRVPHVSSAQSTLLFLYYGNTNVSVSQENAHGVWDQNFVGVWHENNNPDETQILDSTANQYHGTRSADTLDASDIIDAQIGPGLNYRSEYVTCGGSSARGFNELTAEVWYYKGSLATNIYRHPLIGNTDYDGVDDGFRMYSSRRQAGTRTAANYGFVVEVGDVQRTLSVDYPDSTYAKFGFTNSWHYLVGTWDGSVARLYYEGQVVASNTDAALGVMTNCFDITLAREGSSGQGMWGDGDEMRVSDVCRGPDWIAACYANQNEPDTFAGFGPAEEEAVAVSFDTASSSGSESTAAVLIGVSLAHAHDELVTVGYSATGGTAGSGTDYLPAAGRLTFEPGITAANVALTVLNDGLVESAETVVLSLSAPGNAVLGGTLTHTYTINDNDPEPVVKIDRGAAWQYRRGTAEASDPGVAWRGLAFDDAGWDGGNAAFGYGQGPYGTELTDMRYFYSSVFLRREFQVASPGLVKELRLWALYDDGFILWLNGDELARVNMSGAPGSYNAYDGFAATSVDTAMVWNVTLQGAQMPVLQKQTNVLAVQVFNHLLSSADLTMDLELAVVHHKLTLAEDADQDGLPDGWEAIALNGTGQGTDDDGDQDGPPNIAEYIAGTGPTNENSYFKVELSASGGGGVIVSFLALPCAGTGYEGLSRHYALETRGVLQLGDLWQIVPGYSNILGQGQTVTYTNPAPAASGAYRGKVWLE